MAHLEETIFVPTVADFAHAAAIVEARGIKKILLYGEMGAGKTTFARAFAKQLGASSEAQSPTFSLVNSYFLSKNGQHTGGGDILHHLDLYRLKSLEEALDIGIEDILFDSNYCLIEWAQIIEPLLERYFSDSEILAVQIETLEGKELTDFLSKNKKFVDKISIQPRKVVILPNFQSKKDFL
ncbi:MAG: hypothetical protein RL757_796 [Bacteroidota bacterium]|jgi:tRNA threonylcarbamoyladenosine biosynthesis protein TsaE